MHPTTSKFIQFAHDLRHNAWFHSKEADIYCRVAWRSLVLPETDAVGLVETFDLANIVVRAPGNGLFTEILTVLETEDLGVGALFVENVIDPRFQAFFTKRGYARHDDASSTTWPPSFWRSFVSVESVA